MRVGEQRNVYLERMDFILFDIRYCIKTVLPLVVLERVRETVLFSLQEEDPSLSAVRIKHFQKHRPRFLKLHFPPSLSLPLSISLSLSLSVSHSVARVNTKQKACLSYLLFQTIHKKNTFFFFLACNFTVS
jgi:hypothetical protein